MMTDCSNALMFGSAREIISFALDIIQVWEMDILQCSLECSNEEE